MTESIKREEIPHIRSKKQRGDRYNYLSGKHDLRVIIFYYYVFASNDNTVTYQTTNSYRRREEENEYWYYFSKIDRFSSEKKMKKAIY